MPRVRMDPLSMFFVFGMRDGVRFIELHVECDPAHEPAPVIVRDEVPTKALYADVVRLDREAAALRLRGG